jgi:hypothetical protein
MKTKLLTLVLLISVNTFAQEPRHIHFNGEHLDQETILVMDQLYGYQLANGNYWINTQTGEWGFEGDNRVQGVLSQVAQIQQQSNQQPPTQQPSQSKRRAEINLSQNGSVVSGKLNGKNCTFVSAGGMTMKSCD